MMLFLFINLSGKAGGHAKPGTGRLLHPVVSFRLNLTTNLFGRPDLQNSNKKKPTNHSL